jgi:hypothetical protein
VTPAEEERQELMVAALDRLIAAELAGLRREIVLTNSQSERAIHLASQESKERLEAHNGLIEQMRQQASHYATREIVAINHETSLRRFERVEKWQAQMTGALVLISLALPIATAYLIHLLN